MADRLLDQLTAEQYRGWPSPTPPSAGLDPAGRIAAVCAEVLAVMRTQPDGYRPEGVEWLTTPEERQTEQGARINQYARETFR